MTTANRIPLLPAVCGTTVEATKARIRASREAREERRAFWASREDWLTELMRLLRPRYIAAGHPLPEKLSVSVSWAYTRGLRDAHTVWGQCFPPEVSRDKQTTQIIVAPWADAGDRETTVINEGQKRIVRTTMYYEVLNTMLHEGIHAAVGTKCGHNGPFRKAAVALGYANSDFETTPLTPALTALFDTLALRLGYYPHSAIQLNVSDVLSGAVAISNGPKPVKPSNAKNKYVKVVCEESVKEDYDAAVAAGEKPRKDRLGYFVRMTDRHLRERGAPICPCHGKPMTPVGKKKVIVKQPMGSASDEQEPTTATETATVDTSAAPF